MHTLNYFIYLFNVQKTLYFGNDIIKKKITEIFLVYY